MQPLVAFVDAPLWATGYLRTALAARPEPYAAGVAVGVLKSPAGRCVTVNRDGGAADRVQDHPRLRVRVWADTWQEASDLARLVRTLLLASPGVGPVVWAGNATGPSDVPEETSQAQFLFYLDLTTRGTNLT